MMVKLNMFNGMDNAKSNKDKDIKDREQRRCPNKES